MFRLLFFIKLVTQITSKTALLLRIASRKSVIQNLSYL